MIQKLISDIRKLPDASIFPLARAQVVYRQTNMTKKYRTDMVTFAKSLIEKYPKYFVAYKVDLSTRTYEPILMVRLQDEQLPTYKRWVEFNQLPTRTINGTHIQPAKLLAFLGDLGAIVTLTKKRTNSQINDMDIDTPPRNDATPRHNADQGAGPSGTTNTESIAAAVHWKIAADRAIEKQKAIDQIRRIEALTGQRYCESSIITH